ncbi:MAG: galactokinase family protein, partial [Candidatus Caldatribacteriota bacterium]
MNGKKIGEVFEDLKDFIHFSAPGRINIIGEHTDYNNGYV